MGRAIGLIILGVLAVILFTIGFSSLSGGTGFQLAGVEVVAASDETAVAKNIVFAGKITNPVNGQWENDYTVIPYLNNKEISNPQNRAISRIGKYHGSGEGVHDGLFVVYIPNIYELTAEHDFINADGELVEMHYAHNGGFSTNGDLYVWLREMNPGDVLQLRVPEKQIEYAIAIMSENNADLSEEIHQNETMLQGEQVVAVSGKNSENETVTQPNIGKGGGAPPPDTQMVGNWTREYTAPADTIVWDTWTLYVENQVPGMDWDTYYEEVMIHNPDLAQTRYFVKGQIYYLPNLPEREP